MLESILIGTGFAFAAAVQPGPLLAFLLSRAASRGWRATMPAALSPLVSDGPIAIIVLTVIQHLTLTMQRGLRFAGGFFLLYLTVMTLRDLRKPAAALDATATSSAPRTVLEAATVNFLNPNAWLGWSLVLGPLIIAAWHRAPSNGVALVAAFYLTMLVSLAAIIFLFGTAHILGPRARRILMAMSAAALAAIGVWQLVTAIRMH
ncbi:MAG: LysE family transporter [Thermoanaerobaculia bacterium]